MQAVGEKYKRCSKISEQIHIIEEIGENGKIQYNCTACRKVFRSRSQRYYHIKCNQLQDFVFRCEYCDKSFVRQTQLKYHIESHISPVNECDLCQKTFSNPFALKKHLSLHKVEPKLCLYCDKTFKKKISLDQHIASQHLNKLQYGCAHCSKKYASKSALQLHLQTHEGKRFECTFCGKFFQRNSILNLHLKRHYNRSSYVCTVCQKAFSESGALARHRKIHEESVLQYYCKLCDKSMLRKDNMTRHIITIHPEEKFDEIVKTIESSIQLPTQEATEESDIFQSDKPRYANQISQDNIMKTDKRVSLIENKELHDPFKYRETINNENTVEHPLINQIKVITAVPSCVHSNGSITNDFENQYKNTNHQDQQGNSTLENQEPFYNNTVQALQLKNNVVQQKYNNAENISFINHFQSYLTKTPNQKEEQTIELQSTTSEEYNHTRLNKIKPYSTNPLNQPQSVENESTTFSSVIRSIGNVKKSLSSNTAMPNKPIKQMSLEYKHKKYCRNNYNIDLYRKILGCDENADDENIDKQEKFNHMLKSSTPVHWRKSFKNNYETKGS